MTAGELDVRTITDEEVPAWSAAVNTGFHNAGGGVDAEHRRPGLILDRTWAGFDGGLVVSTFRSFPTELTVPGGRQVSTSAITAVTTSATHRRRGLASRMMIGDLTAAKERGEQSAVLIAAEWPIYGRFGFGPATEYQTMVVDARAAKVVRTVEGSVEFADIQTGRALAPRIQEQARRGRPGDLRWLDRMWDFEFGLLRFPSSPEPKKFFTVVARDPSGAPIGIARYEFEEKWEQFQSRSTVNVPMLIAIDARAATLLWSFLIDLDLVMTIRADLRPVDELVPWLLANGRNARPDDRGDMLWLRPLDTPALLTARSYSTPGRLVLEVVDPVGLAGGRFALDAGPHGATCTPTTESADLTLHLSQLSSILLGGYPARTLFAAGLIDEHRSGAHELLDALFPSPVTPWCSLMF